MYLSDYQKKVLRTFTPCGDIDKDLGLCGLGLAGESGETIDHIKKVLHHGHVLDTEKLVEEMGDVMWYLAALAHTIGTDLEYIGAMNIKKLEDRYPQGFDPKISQARQVLKTSEQDAPCLERSENEPRFSAGYLDKTGYTPDEASIIQERTKKARTEPWWG